MEPGAPPLPPLLLLPPPPVYSAPTLDSAYAADATFSPRAMRPLYGATRALTALLLPPDTAPPGVVRVTASGSLALGPFDEVGPRLLAHYAPAAALAAATLAFAALLPLAGLCWCCARACARPRPQPPRRRGYRRRAACRRAALGLTLAAIATAMLFGVVCAFVTNEYMQEGTDALTDRLRVATRDAHLYLNNTRTHLSHLLVTNFQELRDNLEHALNTTGKLIVIGLKSISNATILDNVANLTIMLDSTQEDLHLLQNLTNDTYNSARILDDELKVLGARAEDLHAQCLSHDKCHAALNASAAASHSHFLQMATAAAEAAAAEEAAGARAAAGALRRSVADADEALRAFAARMDGRVAAATPPLRAALADLGAAVADYDAEAARALAGVSAALRRGSTPALQTLDEWRDAYSRYRYLADAGASAALLLVVLLLALGLLYGFCGKAPMSGDSGEPHDECCARSTGGRWLLAAVTAMFALGSALALAALAHLVGGLLAQQAVCTPLRPPRPAPLLALADAQLAPGDARAAGDGRRLAEALALCHANRSAYAVLGLAARRDASELLALADSAELRERLGRLRAALPEGDFRVRLLSAEASAQLRGLSTWGAAAERAAAAAGALAAAATSADLDALAARLDDVPTEGLPVGVGRELRALADALRRAQRGPLASLRTRASALNATAVRLRERLRLGQPDARVAATAAAQQLDAAQRRLDERGSQLLAELGDGLSREVEARVGAHLRRVVAKMENGVGPCAPLSRALNASLVAVCDEVLLPVNGWWVGCGLCLVLFIPALVVASCLATHYRRPHSHHYVPAGPDAEYLYDAYSDRDNIPLASAGKKRGPRRYADSYHDNAGSGGGGGREGAGGAAYEFPMRGDHQARFSDMAPKHWDLQTGALPPRYLGPEYERPPPYYYPGPQNCSGRR